MKKLHSKPWGWFQSLYREHSTKAPVTWAKQRIKGLSLFLTIILLILLDNNTYSQTFLPPYQPAPGYAKGFVILKDSTKIEGSFRQINNVKNIKSCTIKDANDQKHTFKTQQIDKVYISLSGLDKLNTYSDFSLSFRELYHLDFKELLNPEYFIWENVNCDGKEKVLQLLNPGFDSRIKVFRNPNAIQEGGDQENVGEDISYYMQKTGTNVATLVKKKNYPQQFMQLFSDCPELIESLQGKNIDWYDFATHVYIYDQFRK